VKTPRCKTFATLWLQDVAHYASSNGIHWTQDQPMLLTNDALEHTETQSQELLPLSVKGGYLATITGRGVRIAVIPTQ
jgi:hypothetical protein